MQAFSYVPADAGSGVSNEELQEERRGILYRQIAWANTLRLQLRRSTMHNRDNIYHTPDPGVAASPNEPRVQDFISAEEYAAVTKSGNPAAQLLRDCSGAQGGC